MPQGLIDHESFLKLEPVAQENLLHQSLLLWLTGLELAERDPDAWEAEAFTSAIELLAMQAPRTAYRDVERMLLPPGERLASERGQVPAAQNTSILRIDISENTPAPPPPREAPNRNALRRRLLQLSAIQPESDMVEARRSVIARSRRNLQPTAATQPEGDEAGD